MTFKSTTLEYDKKGRIKFEINKSAGNSALLMADKLYIATCKLLICATSVTPYHIEIL